MAIGVTAKLVVQAGKNAEFEKIFLALARSVRDLEPGCNFYELHKTRDDDVTYMVLEQYADETALQAHGQTGYFKQAGAKLAGCLAAAPQIESFPSVE